MLSQLKPVALTLAALTLLTGIAYPLFVTALARLLVFVADAEVHLTPTEYKLFSTLVRYRGRVVTQRHLLKEVWGLASVSQTQ